jgi:hypothetical protein
MEPALDTILERLPSLVDDIRSLKETVITNIVLIGQIPLENLDLVVDLHARRLTGNPAHGGEQVFELY